MSKFRFTIEERVPTPSQYNSLRKAVGWDEVDPDIAQRALSHSIVCFCAVADGSLIGTARLVGDGELYLHGQDLLVLPKFQRKGVGKALIQAVTCYARHKRSASFAIIAARGKASIYESLGFQRVPEDGPAMFWPANSKPETLSKNTSFKQTALSQIVE